MKNTKLIQLLSAFDKNEAKQFELFLASPFFNTSEKVIALYSILMQYYPDFSSSKLEKEKIFRKLYPDGEYNDQTMRKFTSAIYKLAMEFISYQQLSKIPIEVNSLRHSWLTERGLRKINEQELADREVLLDAYSPRDHEYYYQRSVADYHQFTHHTQVLRDLEHKLLKENLDRHLHSLNKYYLLRFLESYIYLLGMVRIYGYKVDSSLAAHIDELAEKYTGQGDPVIDVHYNIYRLLHTHQEQYFFVLKAILLSDEAAIPMDLKGEISIALENYCVQMLRVGDKRFAKEILEVLRYEIRHELMLVNGEMPYAFFISVITMETDMGITDWLKEFKEKYKSKLPVQHGQHVYDFCSAYMLFAEGKHEEALRIAAGLSPYNEFHKIDIKNLIARVQYELGMYDQLDILLDSYPYYLNGKSLLSLRKANHEHFTIALRQIVELRRQYSASSWQKLYDEMNEVPGFTHKVWLTEKMEEMKR